MKKNIQKKLSLRTETLRALSDALLAGAAGGKLAPPTQLGGCPSDPSVCTPGGCGGGGGGSGGISICVITCQIC